MKAKVISQHTGKVLVVFGHGTMTDIVGSSVFFKIGKEEAEGMWGELMAGVRGGEIYSVTPSYEDGSYAVQALGEHIDWEV